MASIVQAKCPGCKKVLRVPADWVHKTMKCRHCGMKLQAKPAAAAAVQPATQTRSAKPARPAPAPAPAPESPAPSEDDLGSFLPTDDDHGPIIRTPYRRNSGGKLWQAVFVVLLLAVGGVAVYLARSSLSGTAAHPGDRQAAAGSSGHDEGEATGDTNRAGAKHDLPLDAWCPRRALLICVSNYLYANPVGYGVSAGRKGQNLNTLAGRLSSALRIPPEQIVELSDGAPERPPDPMKLQPVPAKGKAATKKAARNVLKNTPAREPPKLPWPTARPTVKPVLERAIADFLDGCRGQDRILLLFAGHAVVLDDQAYLAPLEGDLAVKETLLPLRWVYDRLAACKARQKVLVLDVCRYDPARGLERPGSGPMATKLDGLLQKPPPGVQVWSSCVAEQIAHEFDGGSVFLDKLYDALGTGGALKGIQQPRDPLPVDALAETVGKATQTEIEDELKVKQTPRLTGQEGKDGADYDPAEPPPSPVVVEEPTVPGGAAPSREIKKLLDEVRIPPIKLPRAEASPLPLEVLVPFSAKVLDEYQADYASIRELLKIESKRQQYPLRAAVEDAVDLLQKYGKTPLMEDFRGKANDQVKAAILETQREPARIINELQEGLDAMRKAGERRDEDKSRRWQAHYDYILAQLLARLAYVHEYNLMLGRLRQERLPELNPKVHGGWRLASREKLQSPKEVKDLAAESRKILDKLVKQHRGTPWEILAGQARLTALGLEWQPSR